MPPFKNAARSTVMPASPPVLDEPCDDGCGLSATECRAELYAQLVKRCTERLAALESAPRVPPRLRVVR
jgi:hypothetical protein